MDYLSFSFPGYRWYLWVYFLDLFLFGSHVSLAWVELLVPGALDGKILWSLVIAWVELLVP